MTEHIPTVPLHTRVCDRCRFNMAPLAARCTQGHTGLERLALARQKQCAHYQSRHVP